MKSFCIKTNNTDILNYLLERIKIIDFENIAYSKNKFRIYENIIIHYQGKNNLKFYNFLCSLLQEVIIEFYEENLIKQLINYNYFYFDEYERNRIAENCLEMRDSEEYKMLIENKKYIKNRIMNYAQENKTMVLDGFVYFRLQDYTKCLDNLVDIAVNQFVIEKEYTEFINLLRIYVESKLPEFPELHLIYNKGESILLDSEKNVVSISDNIYNAKYLSDISFSSNDYALNTLLTLLPEKIEIHLIDEEDEFINTIKLIFENRVSICKDCNICKTYRLLNNARIIH